MFERLGIRWGFTYLRTDSRLSEEDRYSLMVESTDMYLNKEERRKVGGEGFEGVLHNTKKYQLLGTFGGIEFIAEIDTDHGKSDLSFIVSEQTLGPGYSGN